MVKRMAALREWAHLKELLRVVMKQLALLMAQMMAAWREWAQLMEQ